VRSWFDGSLGGIAHPECCFIDEKMNDLDNTHQAGSICKATHASCTQWRTPSRVSPHEKACVGEGV
jgi:hypothetical protein